VACIVLCVVVCCHGMGISRCSSVFILSLQFLDRLNDMGSHTSIEVDCQMDSNLSGLDLLNEKYMA